MASIQDIRIRDPFVLPLPERRIYCLYGTSVTSRDLSTLPVFYVRASPDLAEWSDPAAIFSAHPDFWGTRDFWAPEVHFHEGRYWLFASFKAENKCRGTHILVAGKPEGPFRPVGPEPATPPEWECLDGTFWREPDGSPWIVFCHEWLQCANGEIRAQRLKRDLSGAAGDPVLLFRAGDAPGVSPLGQKVGSQPAYVTDGPFLWRTATGALNMIWASFGDGGYREMVAVSEGGVTGPWRLLPDPLFEKDGGHGMLFRDFGGQLQMCLHQPNHANERMVIVPMDDSGDVLRVARG